MTQDGQHMSVHMLLVDATVEVIETENPAHPHYPDKDPGDVLFRFARHEGDGPPAGYVARTLVYYEKDRTA